MDVPLTGMCLHRRRSVKPKGIVVVYKKGYIFRLFLLWPRHTGRDDGDGRAIEHIDQTCPAQIPVVDSPDQNHRKIAIFFEAVEITHILNELENKPIYVWRASSKLY
ncbi:hypothetical protein [Kushneria phosphatilytica]|uniref:hypothetical protein n=1 Tax=Kushneria phosphatilytica TaxID=657387 RepID=UPI0008DA8B79|nr:hypothetical protein [Kushneria phosphatilytica]OHV10514.1 hypothetical protein BH688_08870 [Kushneria phosphatilytica]